MAEVPQQTVAMAGEKDTSDKQRHAGEITNHLTDTITKEKETIPMWKHTCQCLILLALASLPCAHPTQAAMMVKDAEEQIHLITDARDIWDLSEPGMDTVGYMCSDLDGNGRLEILVAESGGTGLHTYTKIYEVNEAKDALIPCGRSWPDARSEADIMMTNYVPMSVNGIDGIQWYSFTDEYRDGAEYGTANLALSLQDGMLHAKTITTTHTFYDDAGRPHVSYENAAGASISEKAYHKTLENVFAHSETTLISFPWLIYHRDTFHEWKEKSPTDIYTMLLDTYLNFSGEKRGWGDASRYSPSRHPERSITVYVK